MKTLMTIFNTGNVDDRRPRYGPLLLIISLAIGFCTVPLKVKAMDKLITNINTLVSEKSLNQVDIEIALQVKLVENKKAGNPEMKIFESSLWTSSSLYKVELRIYNQGSKYFLLIYPDSPLSINPAEIKQVFNFVAYNPADERRQEPAGYQYEKNDHSISFYYDSPGKKVVMVSLEGLFNSN